MSSIFIIIFLTAYLVLAIKKIDWALMFILAALPLYLVRFRILGIPTTFLEMMIIFCFIAWVVKETEFVNFLRGRYSWTDLRINAKQRAAYPFALEIILFLLASWVALFVAGFDQTALGIWKAYFFEPILVFLMILNIFVEKDGEKSSFSFDRVLWPIAVSVFFVSAYAVFQKFTGIGIVNEFWRAVATRRVTSFFPYPNAVGLYLAPLIFVLGGWMLDSWRLWIQKGKMFFATRFSFVLTAIVLSVGSIYFAHSEGALVGILASTFIFLFLYNRQSKVLVILLIMIGGFLLYSDSSIQTKVLEKLSLRDLSGEIRKQQWRETWQMMREGRIWQGTGLANYQDSIKPYHQEGIFFNKERDPDFRRKIIIFDNKYKAAHWQPVEIYMYPHNIILNFWTELGIFGVLVFVWIIAKYIFIALKNSPNWAQRQIAAPGENSHFFLNLGLLCAMIAIVVHGLVDVPYFKNDLSIMFWIFVALIGMIQKKVRSEK